MIHVLEGPNYVGKTTVAGSLGERFSVPVYSDPGRAVVPVETARDWVIQGIQNSLDVGIFSNRYEFIVDRWVMTNLVYDRRRGVRWPDGMLEYVVSVSKARVYYLDVEPVTLLGRSRGDRPGLRTIDDAAQLIFAYRRSVEVLRSVGLDVRVVSANGSPSEVLDAVVREWVA